MWKLLNNSVSSLFLPVVFSHLQCNSYRSAQHGSDRLLPACAQIPAGVLEDSAGRGGANGHQSAPKTSHFLLTPRHEPLLPASVCQGTGWVLKSLLLCIMYCIRKNMIFKLWVCFSGPCCWCVWSLLSASHRDGPPTAIPDQENCRRQPAHPTANLWSLLVLFPVRGNARNSLLTCAEEFSVNNLAWINFLQSSSSIWWSSRRHSWGDKWGSSCCSSVAPKRSTVNSEISTRLTPTCGASRSFWRSRGSSWGEESWLCHLAPLYSMILLLVWWVNRLVWRPRNFTLLWVRICMTFFLLHRWSTLKHVLK